MLTSQARLFILAVKIYIDIRAMELASIAAPVLRSGTTTRWGDPVSDARSNCVLLPCRCSTLKHAIPKQQSWFLDGGPTCIVHNMASLSMSCVQHCCAGDPFPTLPNSEAILYLTHGRNVYCYHVDVPPSCLLYTRTLHGFWKFAPYAFSLTWASLLLYYIHHRGAGTRYATLPHKGAIQCLSHCEHV